jgi:hypothetical protein
MVDAPKSRVISAESRTHRSRPPPICKKHGLTPACWEMFARMLVGAASKSNEQTGDSSVWERRKPPLGREREESHLAER